MSRRIDQVKIGEGYRRRNTLSVHGQSFRSTTLFLGKPIPQSILSAGAQTTERFQEFFASHLQNPNTKQAYHSAVTKFLIWNEAHSLDFPNIEREILSRYFQTHPGSAATIKQHKAAIQQFLDWMSAGSELPLPKWRAKTTAPKQSVVKNKHETLPAQDAKRILDSINVDNIVALRDKTIIAMMLECVGIRVGSIASMLISDIEITSDLAHFICYQNRPGHIRKQKIQRHLSGLIDEYLERAGLNTGQDAPLFRSVRGRTRQLTDRAMHRTDILRMVKRRAKDAEITTPICCDSFRYLGLRAKMIHSETESIRK